MTKRKCRVCGKALRRRSDEKPSWFLRRVTCGLNAGCSRILAKRFRSHPHKRCRYCDKSLIRRHKETSTAFARRITCGHRCAACLRGHPIRAAVTVHGIEMLRSEAAKMLGLSDDALRRRIRDNSRLTRILGIENKHHR